MRLYYALALLIVSFSAQASDVSRFPKVLVHYVQLQQAEGNSILHTVFAVRGSSLIPRKMGEGTFQTGVRIEMQFYKGDSLFFQDAFNMLSPVVSDSLDLNTTFLHQNRYALKDGVYKLVMKVNDVAAQNAVQEISTQVRVKTEKKEAVISEPILFTGANSSNMDPLIPSGDYFLAESTDKLQFAVEAYNLSNHVEGKALAKYYLSDGANNIMSNYASFDRIETAPVVQLKGGFNVSELTRGLYFLNIEILNQEGEVISKSQTLFYRQSSLEKLEGEMDETQFASMLWLPPVSDVDSLNYLVDALFPVTDNLDRNQINNLLDYGTPIQKKRFVANYWTTKHPDNPEQSFKEYMSVVANMNKRYGTRAVPGYKTERGRVFLQYGAPDLVEDRKYEPSMYPYEIWQYNRLSSASSREQVNRVFIFANLSSAGNHYELIHSNAEGEMFNDRWSVMLNRRVLPQMGIDETGSDIIQHGGRSNSNLIINGGSMDRINRR